VIQQIQARLDREVQSGALTSVRVRDEGGRVVVAVEYRGALGNPRIDRLLVDAGTEVMASVRTLAGGSGLLTDDVHAQLRATAAAMVPPTGGILAADESVGTAGRRLASIKQANTPENRQAMRRVLLTPAGLQAAGIAAVILDRDTLANTVSEDDPTLLVAYLNTEGILPGLKTDEGLSDDPAHPAKTGMKLPNDPELTKLSALLERAKAAGLRFTKYRTTIRPNDPDLANIRANARVQAKQAQLAQAAGLVPMVEPEVVHDGSDDSPATHDLATSYATTTLTLTETFAALAAAEVEPDGMILKTSMILAGKKAPGGQTDPETVGFETLKGLLKTVPAAVGGIAFLSGGQGEGQATANLDAVIRAGQSRFAEARDAAVAELRQEGNTARADAVTALTAVPWPVSYSFGRELQGPARSAWAGEPGNIPAAQAAMLRTARETQRARQGLLRAWMPVSVPEDFVPALRSHGLRVTKVEVKPLQGQAVPQNLLGDRLNAFGVSGSVAQALGSIFFAGRG
jgi:fructose-bisphosphate aldolase class I